MSAILEVLITACATVPQTHLCTKLLRLRTSLRYHRSKAEQKHAAVLTSFRFAPVKPSRASTPRSTVWLSRHKIPERPVRTGFNI